MDLMDPIISGCWVVWDDWLWWVWEFQLGWREWVPCYTHLSFTLRNQFEKHHEVMTEQLVEVMHLHLLAIMHGLWGHYLGTALENVREVAEGSLAYTTRSAMKSAWYYDSIPGYSS